MRAGIIDKSISQSREIPRPACNTGVVRYSQQSSAGEAVEASEETADNLDEKAAADVTYYPLPLPDMHIK